MTIHQKGKIVFDALLIVFLGMAVGFAYNLTRTDGFSIKTRIPSAEELSQAAPRSSPEEAAGKPVEAAFISLEEARRYFESGTAVFLDAREKEEFLEGRIEGAVNIPYGWYLEERPDISGMFDRNKVIVTYCSGTECEASIQLAFAMHERGYGGVKIFFGGWQEWINAGLPITGGGQP